MLGSDVLASDVLGPRWSLVRMGGGSAAVRASISVERPSLFESVADPADRKIPASTSAPASATGPTLVAHVRVRPTRGGAASTTGRTEVVVGGNPLDASGTAAELDGGASSNLLVSEAAGRLCAARASARILPTCASADGPPNGASAYARLRM